MLDDRTPHVAVPVQAIHDGKVIATALSDEKGKYQLRVSPLRFARMKRKVKEITRKTRPLSFTERVSELNSYMKGWIGYFRYANMRGKLHDLDTWIRNRLRYCI